MRICSDEPTENEDTPVEVLEYNICAIGLLVYCKTELVILTFNVGCPSCTPYLSHNSKSICSVSGNYHFTYFNYQLQPLHLMSFTFMSLGLVVIATSCMSGIYIWLGFRCVKLKLEGALQCTFHNHEWSRTAFLYSYISATQVT